jgi:threonine/homoserine/homoserine lactone efflux protein
METVLALVGFSLLSAGTPGPNNVLLWASGATFGLRATVRHVVGTAIGLGAMALGAAAGLAALIVSVPALGIAMKLLGSVYLLVLAWRIGHAADLERGVVAAPLSVVRAAAFQLVNPKAWIFALGAVTTFRPPELSPLAGSLLVAAVMVAVILPVATAWAAAGGTLSRSLTTGRGRRIGAPLMGVLVAATVALAWL